MKILMQQCSALALLCISKTRASHNSTDNLFTRSYADTYLPLNRRRPTPRPTKPKNRPSHQTARPTKKSTSFRRGELSVDVPSLGIKISTGMSVKVIARSNQKVRFANNKLSSIPFHPMPDGAAVFSLRNGGYVYVSNSEMKDGGGGVYGVYFDDQGRVTDYKQLLSGTTRNCSGGATPWNSWVSCEEYSNGQCYQVHPDPTSEYFGKPEMTVLGQDGGNFESVACDDSDKSKPVFYLTEDSEHGALRRYTPRNSSGWNTLHNTEGAFDYLEFLDGKRYKWTTDIEAARDSQNKYFRNVEGIDYFDGKLYFVSKKTYLLYILDLQQLTYVTKSTKQHLFGDGDFTNSPDQIVRGKGADFLYFTEDGGDTLGVYAIDKNSKRYAIFEAYAQKYHGDETTGLAFSHDGKKMYACYQDCGCDNSNEKDCGCLLEFSREDGRSFHGSTMPLKFHRGSRQKQ